MKSLEDIICPLKEYQKQTKNNLEKRVQYCDTAIQKLKGKEADESTQAYRNIRAELIERRKQAMSILDSEELLKRFSILSLQQQINEIIYLFQVYGCIPDLRSDLGEMNDQKLMTVLSCCQLECEFPFRSKCNTLDDFRHVLYRKAELECVSASVIEQLQYGYYIGTITEEEYERFCQKAGIEKSGITTPITVKRSNIDYETIVNLKEDSYPRPLYQKKKTL